MPIKLGAGDVTLRLGSAEVDAAYLGSVATYTGLHPEAKAWEEAVIANSGTVSSTTLAAVSDFCKSIDAAGIRDRFFRLNLFCGGNLSACLVPLYRGPSASGTQHGNTTDTNNGPFVSGDYVETGASGGLQGNGISKYLDTGLPMNYATAASLSNGDRHLAVYKNGLATSTFYSIGVVDSSSPLTLYQIVRVSGNCSYFSGGNTTSLSAVDDAGLWVGTGTASRVLYRNGSSVGSNATGTDTINTATRPFWIFAQNGSGSPVGISNERQCAYSIGRSMTATQVANFYTAMQAFQTALGRNA